MEYCNENLMDCLDNTKYFKKIENGVNNYVNPYTICEMTNFNSLIQGLFGIVFVFVFFKTIFKNKFKFNFKK